MKVGLPGYYISLMKMKGTERTDIDRLGNKNSILMFRVVIATAELSLPNEHMLQLQRSECT